MLPARGNFFSHESRCPYRQHMLRLSHYLRSINARIDYFPPAAAAIDYVPKPIDQTHALPYSRAIASGFSHTIDDDAMSQFETTSAPSFAAIYRRCPPADRRAASLPLMPMLIILTSTFSPAVIEAAISGHAAKIFLDYIDASKFSA